MSHFNSKQYFTTNIDTRVSGTTLFIAKFNASPMVGFGFFFFWGGGVWGGGEVGVIITDKLSMVIFPTAQTMVVTVRIWRFWYDQESS